MAGGKRQAYEDLAAKDKGRYQRELATYNGTGGPIPAKRYRSASNGGRAAQMRRTGEDFIDDAGGRGSSSGGDRSTFDDEGIDVSNIMPEGSRRRVSRHSYVENDEDSSDQDSHKHDDY